MALRNVVKDDLEFLGKQSREVIAFDEKLKTLVEDMKDTLTREQGVGLAAPQVGILKRIVVIDCTGEDLLVMINPKIIETSGEQTGGEGCLSVPGKSGTVTRPNYVKAIAYD